jgi:phasin family protein
MITRPSQLIELHRMQVDAFAALGHAVIAAAEKLSDLNLSAGRLAMDSATEAAHSLASAKDTKGAAAMIGAYAPPPIEQLMSYSRNLMGIGNGVQAEVAQVMEAQLAEGERRVSALVEYAARNAPAGSETAVSLLRGAVAAGRAWRDR